MTSNVFPKGFIWGTATASFQIEGASHEDGRGESIWDRFAATPGKILTGETGIPACDSYHRYQDDIVLMQAMNQNAYRLSIAWPRIIPDGDGKVNPLGLDYYDRVTDNLLKAGIAPFITLYHWDLPQALQDEGGWANHRTIDAYVRFVDITVSRLGDRVKHWSTHNEPWCISFLSHELGAHAPGLTDRKIALQVAHNVLLSHGLAVPIIRQRCPGAQVGIVLNFTPAYPATDSVPDQVLTRQEHARFNLWFLDPIVGRGYPQDAWEGYGRDVPQVGSDDLKYIATPIDYLGINYYSRKICHDPLQEPGSCLRNVRDETNMNGGDWEIYPQGLYDLLIWIGLGYNFKNLFVTENGASYKDRISPDGKIHDSRRKAFIHQHLERLLKAIEAGIPVRGYFYWSLMDNFEWALGTSSRFGLAYTDYSTQKRTLKESAIWYGKVAAENALSE